jgi:thiamine kinase-like enzyme
MDDLGAIVEGLQRRLGAADGPAVALDGGITNRNYRVRFGDRDYVVRIPGKDTTLLGISRKAERMANETAAALGIAPMLAASDEDYLVTEFVASDPIQESQLVLVAASLRSFHDSGLLLPVRFWVPELLERYGGIVRERGGALPDQYALACELARRIADVLPREAPVPCHNDLLPSNLLSVAPDHVLVVDWEYAGMGHRLFDLGNLAVNNELDDAAEERVLAAYCGQTPGPVDRAAMKLMRIMSDAREGAWGVIQGVLSELDFDFDGYAARHFERLADAASDPRLDDWMHAAAA